MGCRVALRIVSACLIPLWSTLAFAQSPPPEYQVKAEFIERFTRFVTWPGSVFADAAAPFVMCFAGRDEFGSYFSDLAQTGTVQGRRIVVRHLDDDKTAAGCHLLFISGSERSRLRPLLDFTSGKPILTIGDTQGFAEAGVLINLFLENGKYVRFEINVPAVDRSGLIVSSRLMKLAHRVPGEGEK
jgi:hypothetical protein